MVLELKFFIDLRNTMKVPDVSIVCGFLLKATILSLWSSLKTISERHSALG